MYNNAAAASGGTLAMTGLAYSAYGWGWGVMALLVVGGAAVTVSKMAPRISMDPIRENGKYRLRLTKNGQPWRQRKRRH
jgi:hypothetical protein